MPIVTAHCRVVDGLGKPEQNPQVFLKVRGKFYRTHVHLKGVYKCRGGWVGSVTHYRADISNEDKEQLRKLAIAWTEEDQSKYAVQGDGLKHCGIRFVV